MTAIVPAALAADPELLHISTLHARRLVVVAGLSDVIDDIDDADNEDGYEDAEDAAFWSIVHAGLNDACGICGYWACRCLSGAAPVALTVLAPVGGSGQCSVCQGWFDDWPGGVCGACQQNGY